MVNYNKKIIDEALKVVSEEELICALLGESDDNCKQKLAIVFRVLLDEYNESDWGNGNSYNLPALSSMYNEK